MDPLDALRDARLDAAAARALLDRAAVTAPEALRAIASDAEVAPVVRRLAIRRLCEAEVRAGATLAEAGAAICAGAWLEPADVRHVSVVIGKIPVQWLAEDFVVAIDVCPTTPGTGDRHRLLIYLRIAGQPELEEVVEGLRGGVFRGEGAAPGALEVRELGFFETEAPRPDAGAGAASRPPAVSSLVICRRALCDSPTGKHTLVDVVVELQAPLPGPATFDLYLQLRRLGGPATLTLEVLDGGGGVLTTGTLSLGASREAPAEPPPPALGVAIPNVTVVFEQAGEHLLRVRCGDEILAEHRFDVVDAGGA